MDPLRSFIPHAHFYQPPREYPLTNEIPMEPGASPYHDWNEKIFETCYLPNIKIGNFSKISYDIGPTLTRWMRTYHPQALQTIVRADQQLVQETGYGNAIAQPFHHTILPLATKAEKNVEITWGIRDFIHTFGRRPQGMWLPETAVDKETLCILAENGIRFTILAPWQVCAEGEVGSLYRIELPNHRSIAAFVYSGEISAQASFDRMATSNADQFVNDAIRPLFGDNENTQLIMMATDGELYGHHQEFREMFLSQMVNGSLKSAGISLEFPERYLAEQKDIPAARIRENTSWSCHHGIRRWQQECECSPGAKWKKPLREYMNSIANDIDLHCKEYMQPLGIDLDESRKSYIDVMLDEISFDSWLSNQTIRKLDKREQPILAKLFRAQEFRLRMFVSCAWFFSEFDRIEPRNSIINAVYAVFLVENALQENLAEKYARMFSSVIGENHQVTGDKLFSQYHKIFVSEALN